jgi:adenosylmethionine-8-amino-7-oxononanoate aminotransferase
MLDLPGIDRNHIWHPFTPLVNDDEPIFIESAEGVYLTTKDGRKIIDAISSWWVNLHGHAHPHIVKAISEQVCKLEHVIFAGFTHEPAIQLAKNLLSILPTNQSKIFYSDNGSTAVEVALKMAFQFWYNQGIEKRRVIALKGAYHGDTFGAMSVGDRSLFTRPYTPYLFEVEFIDFPEDENIGKILERFKNLLSTNSVGAFIYEPLVQGAAGMRMYPAHFLEELIKLAHEQNVVCIADEVFTGFGRTGKIFASDYLQNHPDIISMSKGITGGFMPLGATSCSEKIAGAYHTDDASKMFFHGHSFTANPLACAAANASFEILMNEKCVRDIKEIGEQHEAFINMVKNHPVLHSARQCGTILALELKNEENTGYLNPIRKRIYSYFLERNILLRPLGNVIYCVPPYVIKANELKVIYSAIEEFLELV